MLLNDLEIRCLSTVTAKPFCKGVTVLTGNGANVACVRDSCFIGTFANLPINAFKVLGKELLFLSLIKSVVGQTSVTYS